MTEDNNAERTKERKGVAIEGNLPLKAAGIENLKEDNPKHMPPNRYMFPWYARRPTPAARLAVLASILPEGTDHNELLSLMQIKPKHDIEGSIEEYVVEKKATEDSRSGTLGDHYGYPRPFESSPSEEEQESLHSKLKQHWDGELPTVLDPTAGSGVIPLESLRYGLPTKANELNPVPSLMLKTILEYPVSVGTLRNQVNKWGSKVNEIATERLAEYYPGETERQTPSHYVSTYTIVCDNCGSDIPLTSRYWLLKRSASEGIAVRPVYNNGDLEFELVELPGDVTKDEFNPQNGPRSRGGNTECPNCGIVTESKTVKERMKSGEYEYAILGAKFTKSGGGSGYRTATEEDYQAYRKAVDRVESDYELFSLLNQKIPENGQKTSEPAGYGFTQWRDVFTARQLVAHYEYWQAFEEIKSEVYQEHPSEEADAILSILALAGGKMVDRNSRLSPYNIHRGYPMHLTGAKNLSPQWCFTDNNPSSGDQQYTDILDRILSSYEDIVNYLEDSKAEPATVHKGDAADLPFEENSIDSVVVDPPYYSSIMYAELSDIFYVWLRNYMEDIFPDMFHSEVTEKEEEAVANPSEFDGVSGSTSKKELAKEKYEEKMSEIFSELYRVTDYGGVMTTMFTHKEADAWDTLTKSLIRSGFIITATHPITSERPNRADTQDGGSADTTLLLTGRKPLENEELDSDATPTLWSDVRAETRNVAKEAARELLESGLPLTKTDVIMSAFGPTLRVYTTAYPVVDDQDQDVPPRRALEEAREAVTRVLVEEYLVGNDLGDLDDITEWYILSWLVHETDTFDYDDGYQLGLGIGVDIDNIKRSTKIWGKKRGDIQLKSHDDRVQDITLPEEKRADKKPVDPEALSYTSAIDALHAAIHVYEKQGEDTAIDWLKERNYDTDSSFKATLKALLQVLPQDNPEWEAARNLALGRTHDVLGLDFTPTDLTDQPDRNPGQNELSDHV